MGKVFSNSLGGSDENTPTPDWFWGSSQPTQGFGVQQATAPSLASTWDSGAFKNLWNNEAAAREFNIARSYNAMNSPSSSISSGAPWDSGLYRKESPGWFSTDGAMVALQGLQSIFDWTQGNKALDLARDQFNFSKNITQKNLANQTSLLNTAMQDRQNARRAASSSYQDTDSYMREHGL